jgi:NitT/TauT family transport system substrate-binding protein
VAQQQGYFAQQNLAVEFIPVASAPERDQMIASGQADGMINEVLSTILYNKDQTQAQVVRYARTATSTSALFRILASQKSGISDVQGLKGVEVGVSNGTVIEYLTERILQAEGFTPDEIRTVSVPKISDRLALLTSGGMSAGVLPDPLASAAIQQGATLVIDDTRYPDYSYSVMTFRKAVIDAHPEAILGFLAAIESAVVDINRDPNQWRSLLVDQKIIAEKMAENFSVPPFVTAGVPSEAQYADAMDWLKTKGLLDHDVAYGETITGDYLPK